MPPPRKSTDWYQDEMLKKISEVTKKVDESLEQGRENGEGIRLLRRELGVDGDHGRIPQIEQQMGKFEIRMQTLQACVDLMQQEGHFARGKQWVITALLTLLFSSGGIALFEFVFKFHPK